MSGVLYGVGVGPGDPELLTLKAHRLISNATTVAYPAPDSGDSFARSIVAGFIPTAAREIPIVIPMIELLGLHPGLAVAAALGGGIFGDHCSPISDTTIVASMASATDHIDHVRTQMPYAVTAAAGAVVLFVIAGMVL